MRGALPLDEHPAQDLAGGRLRDRVDELQPADLLVGRDPLGDEGHQLLGRGLALEHDERLRHLAGFLVRAGDDGHVGDGRVGEQERLQLGRGDLVALVLDQLLEPVDDGEQAVLVGEADVAGVQPALGVDRLRGRLGLVEVALHDLRPAQADLAALARGEGGSGRDVDDLVLRAGQGGPADPGRSSSSMGTAWVPPLPSVRP